MANGYGFRYRTMHLSLATMMFVDIGILPDMTVPLAAGTRKPVGVVKTAGGRDRVRS